MNLTYRGVSYQTQPRAIATKKTNVTAKFRGLSYQLSQPVEPDNYSPYPLKYQYQIKFTFEDWGKDKEEIVKEIIINIPCLLKYRGISYYHLTRVAPSHNPDGLICIPPLTQV